jgi:hypothetical protein
MEGAEPLLISCQLPSWSQISRLIQNSRSGPSDQVILTRSIHSFQIDFNIILSPKPRSINICTSSPPPHSYYTFRPSNSTWFLSRCQQWVWLVDDARFSVPCKLTPLTVKIVHCLPLQHTRYVLTKNKYSKQDKQHQHGASFARPWVAKQFLLFKSYSSGSATHRILVCSEFHDRSFADAECKLLCPWLSNLFYISRGHDRELGRTQARSPSPYRFGQG